MSPPSAPAPRRRRSGFTLVELMVAITGGLFVTISVFMLAKHGSRFYQREARIGNATIASISGFERLREDIARAGFMVSPNIQRDPALCGDPSAAWPSGIQRLGAVRIEPGGSPANVQLQQNQLDPDRIILAGSYASAEQFPIQRVVNTGAGFNVFLADRSGAVARTGLNNLSTVFRAGRILRIVDTQGNQHYGAIAGTPPVDISNPAAPFIKLGLLPAPVFRQSSTVGCGIRGNCTGCVANVVSVVQYDVRNLATASNFGGANPAFAPIYEDAGTGPGDDVRTELVRVELDTTTGAFMTGTEELVAEYAVDLAFGVTVADVAANPSGVDPTLVALAPGNTNIPSWVGDVTGLGNARGPQLVRSIHARLSVRSREADRPENVVAGQSAFVEGGTTLGPGVYRFDISGGGDAGGAWARVRTVQADIALPNLTSSVFP